MIGPAVALVVTLVVGFVARQVDRRRRPASRSPRPPPRWPWPSATPSTSPTGSAAWVQDNAKRLRAEVETPPGRPEQEARPSTHDKLIPELEARRDADVKAAEERYPKALAEAAKKYEADLSAAEDKYKKDLAEAKANGDRELQELDARHFAEVEARQTAYEAAWQKLIDDWRDGHRPVRVGARRDVGRERPDVPPLARPGLGPLDAARPSRPRSSGSARSRVPMKQIPQGIPEDPRLKELTPEAFTLPAFLQFPDKISLLIKANDEGRGPGRPAPPGRRCSGSSPPSRPARSGSRSSTPSASARTSRPS